MINLHRFEALYYVGLYGGIGPAARAMPWSIGKSAVSKQIAALEEETGTPLFRRDPFEWLPLGRRMYEEISPLYEKILEVSRETCGLTGALLRIAASDFILREYIAGLVNLLRRRHPTLRLQLRAGTREEIERWLRDGAIDLGILTVDDPPEALVWQPLLELPLVLLAPVDHPAKTAAEFWATRPVTQPLITPPMSEGATRRFNAGLREGNVFWPVTIEASSIAMVPWLVTAGQGLGLGVGASTLTRLPGLRALPLPGFGRVTVGALWRGHDTPELQFLLELVGQTAQRVTALRSGA